MTPPPVIYHVSVESHPVFEILKVDRDEIMIRSLTSSDRIRLFRPMIPDLISGLQEAIRVLDSHTNA